MRASPPTIALYPWRLRPFFWRQRRTHRPHRFPKHAEQIQQRPRRSTAGLLPRTRKL